ncbi:hypothetical protein G4B88_001283 [Cannabis sativa]|uniref:Uncharacterized protein n=1 Tax=Cannabis sativa TaxID=3483 RepID=A0A7J6I183_CANSA|nr:hypothetical protein G4B88_001283 [Cannabis sativa]
MVSLKYLNFVEAKFEGKIPHQLGNLSSLSNIILTNREVDMLYADSLHWISSLSSLEYLDLSKSFPKHGDDFSKHPMHRQNQPKRLNLRQLILPAEDVWLV